MKSYDNIKPLDYYDELELREKEIYNDLNFETSKIKIPLSIDLGNICSRSTEIFADYDYNLPQNVFIISKYFGQTIVGRKIRSVLRIENKINAINCSMITCQMLLGILKHRKKSNRKITIEYFPFTNEEKVFVFNDIKKDRKYDIYYPYKYYDFNTKSEEKTSKNGWSFNPDKKEYLGYGEIHFRKFTSEFFKQNNKSFYNIYDPACSTGEFLSDFKKEFPNCHTIGHDLSQEMIDYAKKYVDEALCCDAINSPIANNTIDIMFLRFLNSEVVTTKYAYMIIKVLIKKMQKHGLIVCFGHTPVLIKNEWFLKNGFKKIICNGFDQERDAIFQYYVYEVI